MKFKEVLSGCNDIYNIRIATNGCGIYFVFHEWDKEKLIKELGSCPVKKITICVKYSKIVLSVILGEVGFNKSKYPETMGLYAKCKYYENGNCKGAKNNPLVLCDGCKNKCEV